MSASNTGSMLSPYIGPSLLTALLGKNVHLFLPSKRNIQKWEAKASTCSALPTASLGARNRLGQLFLRQDGIGSHHLHNGSTIVPNSIQMQTCKARPAKSS